MDKRQLVVHLIYRLDFGGLETLLVECVNGMPHDKYKHAVICLTDYSPAFAQKITATEVEFFSLNKPPGLGLSSHLSLFRLLKQIRPSVIHTYNLAAIEYNFIAALAGVPVRIHAEHGRDASDPQGKNWKHNLLRRLLVPFIDVFIPVSSDLQDWLKLKVKIPSKKISLITNGVNTSIFKPSDIDGACLLPWKPDKSLIVIGTVGRIQDVKNHEMLVDAFIRLRNKLPHKSSQLRLAIVGDGPLFQEINAKIAANQLETVVWLPGSRSDISELMRQFTIFALPSLAEGTPVTVLEAMASALPVVATKVGGVPEVITDHVTGTLVPSSNCQAFSDALAFYVEHPEIARTHGVAAREFVEKNNSLHAMLASYTCLYDDLCKYKLNKKVDLKSCAE